MAKKIIYIILGALIVFGLLFLLWSWLFGGSGNATPASGTFGTASSTNQNLGNTSGQGGNGQTSLGNNAGSGSITSQTINVGNTGSRGTGANGTNNSSGSTGTTVTTSSGTTWLGGTGSASAGSGTAFNPTQINSIASGLSGSVPTILTTSGGGGGNSTLGILLGSAAIGVVSCAIRTGAVAASATAGATAAGAVTAANTLSVPVGNPAFVILAGSAANNTGLKNGDEATSIAGCIVNTLAKVALQQITVSVVNWINSGFNGQPAFITNYQQFFTNVADAAAGQFIQGTGLAFLCSPFQLQIKIAIAKAYANRNAQSCTLTGIIKNVNNFMNGAFSQGGWAGFVSFTTVPTNNPYGAFAYAQVGLGNAQSSALANAKNNISPTGFLNLQTLSGCTDTSNNGLNVGRGIGSNPQAAMAGGSASLPPGCKASITTPGGAIASSLDKVLQEPNDQLGIGNDLDQIFNALTTQLLTKSLYSGLSSLSQTTSIDTASQSQDAALLADMQNNISIAQQYGSVEQGSISDIENAQQALNTLANCWGTVASSTSVSSSQQASAAQDAAVASSTLQTLNAQIDGYNNNITNANNEIAELEQFITKATTAGSAADVQTLAANYAAAQAAQPFISQADVTTEQQNRTTLQAQLATLNQTTQSQQAQCTALER